MAAPAQQSQISSFRSFLLHPSKSVSVALDAETKICNFGFKDYPMSLVSIIDGISRGAQYWQTYSIITRIPSLSLLKAPSITF